MIIKHTNFQIGIHNFEFVESGKKIGLEEPFFGDVTVSCRMDKSIYQIVLDLKCTVPVKFECDRCNVEYETEIDSNNKLVCLYTEEEVREDEINVIYLSPEQDKIDISEDVAELLVLSIPMKKVCMDECRGLCSKCGTNLNKEQCSCRDEKTDSVWEPLQKLKGKLNNN